MRCSGGRGDEPENETTRNAYKREYKELRPEILETR